MEQSSTSRFQKNHGHFFLQENRTELEYGLTDRLQVGLQANYFLASAFHNGPFAATTPPESFSNDSPNADDHYSNARYIGASTEVIYRILSPYKRSGVGLAVYIEPTVGPQFREVESKLILQKNFKDDRLVLAANLTYAPEWRHLQDAASTSYSWQEETDANIDLGATYRFIRNWSAGLEVLNEREFNSYNFTHESNSGYFAGPSVHYGGKRFFVTTTYVRQLPFASPHVDTVPGALVGGLIGDNDFEKNRVRAKFGWYF